MGALMLIIAILSAVYPPSSIGGISSTAIAAIAMVYLESGEPFDFTSRWIHYY